MTDKAPTYTPQRAATVKLTQAIHEYLDVKYPDHNIPQPEKNIDGYLDVFLAIHGDGGTPGMVFADTGIGVFDWQVVRESRRLLVLDGIGAHTHDRRRVLKLLDSLLASAPDADVDLGALINREGGLMENVVFHAVHIAADRFNPDPADPGFSSDMHEDLLRDACLEYVQAFLARRAHGA